jgi:predicted ATPase
MPALAIPSSLHDSLMARLDRLGPVKEVAQIGAAIGREFTYGVLRAVWALSEDELQTAVARLVASELVYQRGIPPDAVYSFKHALVRDAAYGSLLRGSRQELHALIAQALQAQSGELMETQPELLAQHYTEAGLIAQAAPYWQQAGQRATERSANEEAIRHLTTGLKLLAALPETPERIQRELTLQALLGVPLMMTKGWGTPEVKQAFTRAFMQALRAA